MINSVARGVTKLNHGEVIHFKINYDTLDYQHIGDNLTNPYLSNHDLWLELPKYASRRSVKI
jgi:hypothetical protein